MSEWNYEKRGYLLEDFRLFHLRSALKEDTAFHYHEFHKLVFFLSGRGNYIVEGRSYALKPYDIVLVQRGAIHKAEIAADATYERVILYISPEFLARQSSADSSLHLCFQNAAREKSFVLRPDYDRREALMRMLSALEAAGESAEYAHDLMERALMIQLLVELGRGLGTENYRYAPAENSGEKTADILEYIHEHLTEDISIDRLAEQFYLSKYYMMRLFRERTGFTIHAYLTDKRLRLARELIAQGMTASEACYRCGYHDYSAFSRAYKKRFAASPRQQQKGAGR